MKYFTRDGEEIKGPAQIIPFPPELAAKWDEIVAACGSTSIWFDRYSHGAMRDIIGDDSDPSGMSSRPPETIGVRGDGDPWKWFDENGLEIPAVDYRDWSERGVPRPILELTMGTYCVFRCTKEELKLLNAGYEDTAGTDNERIIDDGDHAIVVYMI